MIYSYIYENIKHYQYNTLKIKGIIFNNYPQTDPKILQNNIETINKISKVNVLGEIDFNDKFRLVEQFKVIGEKL